ncbi:fibronectin type III domain-containing protein [Pseudomonas citrulli]|uniref:Fibronectin type III domain-containing protein n=1 Tax=Pseudomonas citrulli TaxID=3064347 RepID=A0ABT9BYD4_9PSED|nr:fibronectin type III domain-containing protein [Pseudomonas sp. K18]MDO7897558.1 fibronectin type III domain-containing protein [Pseudomonas sp. K18]
MSRSFTLSDPVDAAGAVRLCAPGGVRDTQTLSKVMLSWDEPYAACPLCPNTIGYEVVVEGFPATTVTRPPCEITGLATDVPYTVQIKAIAAGNIVSQPSVHFLRIRPAVPSSPGALDVSDLSFWSARLKWEPSISNVGNPLYRIYLNDFLVGQVDQPAFNLEHLRSGVNYRVKIVAFNSVGSSEPACVAFKTLLRAPSNLKLKHHAGRCRLSWDPMFGVWPTHEVAVNGRCFTADSLGFNFNLAELSPGEAPHSFEFAVYAKLDEQVSETTRFETVLFDVEPPSRPGQPVATDITDHSVDLAWPPSSDNVGVTGYRVFVNGIPYLYLSQGAHQKIVGLTSGAYYWVYVRARDADGNLSPAGPVTVFKTTGEAPVPPPQAPTDVSITPQSSTTAELRWTLGEGEMVSGVRININGEYKDIALVTTYTLKDLIPDMEYAIRLQTFNYYGQLSESLDLIYIPKDTEPPSVPRNLREIASTSDSVTLAWEESTDDIGMHGYVIYNNCEYFDATPLTHYTVVDLIPGAYVFDVCALDISGNVSEPASLVVEVRT